MSHRLGVPLGEADAPPGPGRPGADLVSRVVVWPDHHGSPVRLVPDPAGVTLPGTVTFALSNDADRALASNLYGWSLWKRAPDGRWAYVCPHAVNTPLHRVPGGEEHRWSVDLASGTPAAGGTLPDPGGLADLAVAGLGGGEYAFACEGTLDRCDRRRNPGDGTDGDRTGGPGPTGDGGEEGHGGNTGETDTAPGGDDGEGTWVAFVARFDVDAPPVELTPDHPIRERRRDDDELAVRIDTDPGEYERSAVLGVERVADRTSGEGSTGPLPVDPEPHVVEGVLRRPGLRTALRAAEREPDARVVRVVAPTHRSPPFDIAGERFVAYDGTTYRCWTGDLA